MKFISENSILIIVLAIIALFAFAPNKSCASEAPRYDKYTEYYAYTITIADWLQTRQIQDAEGIHEKSAWICGEQPSSDCVAGWMLSKIAIIALVNHSGYYNKNAKVFFNVGYSISHTHAVLNNLELGLEIKF